MKKINYAIESTTETGMLYGDHMKENNCIGYLRVDFGGGDEFWSRWFPNDIPEANDEDFKKELCSVVDALRKNLLKSLSGMRKFHTSNPAPEIDTGSYAYKVMTDKHDYYLRCTPMRGEYNCYMYCYGKEAA